jgi:hypothetical protein
MKNLRANPPKNQFQSAWALQLEMHLKEHDPKVYRELKKQGRLKEYCQRQADEALDTSLKLREQGVSAFEAQQIAKAQFIWPTAADMP